MLASADTYSDCVTSNPGPTVSLNLVAINICGYHSKYKLGIFTEYIKDFDIVCLSETKSDNLIVDDLHDFKCITKEKIAGFPHGGIHGLSILHKADIEIHAVETQSPHVLWVKVIRMNFTFILGAVYIPHENSKHYDNELFDVISNDCLNLKTKNDLPIVLMGDFNARTRELHDFLNEDDLMLQELGLEPDGDLSFRSQSTLEALGIVTERHNKDCESNNNGYKLIEFCKTFDIHIANGRIGKDMGVGAVTCDDVSSIDYALLSTELFPYACDFEVGTFDKCLSDKHCPIILKLSVKTEFKENTIRPPPTYCNSMASEFQGIHINWNNQKKDQYPNSFDQSKISELEQKLESLPHTLVTQEAMDEVINELNDIYLNPAEKTGMVKRRKRKQYIRPKPKCEKAWFTQECIKERGIYIKLKNRYSKLKTPDSRNAYAEGFKRYKKFINKAKRQFDADLHKKLRNLKTVNPKEYWDILNGTEGAKKTVNKIAMQVFMQHFKKLNTAGETSGPKLDSSAFDLSTNDFLNQPIDSDDLKRRLKKLKNNKASGIDAIINEFLKNAPENVTSLTLKLFNLILETGIMPSKWVIAIIQPIYKNRGSIDDPDNYRGISLLSCLAKLFTGVLNDRLYTYLTQTGRLGNEQAGFRFGFSTIDHIFVLHSITSLYLNNKKRLFCAFIDYKKAFDLVDRTSLWCKLLGTGVNGKFIRIIYNMYESAKSCIKQGNMHSQTFNCNIGVRQGDNLSPLLFAIYLNDFNQHISNSYPGLAYMADCSLRQQGEDNVDMYFKLFSLLYADDTVVMAESADELQLALNAVHAYCKRWHLTVNASKTKVVVFSRGKIKKKPVFTYGDHVLEIAEDYNYLGTLYNYNAKFQKAIKKQVDQGRRAMFGLIAKCKKLNLPIDIQIELFDQLVLPVLLYGSEVWGFEKITMIENFYTRFLKSILKVKKNTANCMVYAEMGKCQILKTVETRMVNYWHSLITGDKNKISFKMFTMLKNLNEKEILSSPWISKIKSILNNTGMSDMWTQGHNYEHKWFSLHMKNRIGDIYNQNLQSTIEENGHSRFYKLIKVENRIQPYLIKLSQSDRIGLSKFRLGNHNLPIVIGRYENICASARKCNLCLSNDVGDEFHYLFSCSYFKKDRSKYLKPYFYARPNTLKVSELFNSSNLETLRNLSKFCQIIMSKFGRQVPNSAERQSKANV